MSATDTSGARTVGIVGTSDIANYGDLLFPRIIESELSRRVPLVTFKRFAPLGWEHPIAMDGGLLVEPLGRRSVERRAALAGQLDAVVIGGGEIAHTRDQLLAVHYGDAADECVARTPSSWFIEGLGAELEARCPTVWSALGVPYTFGPDEARVVRAALNRRALVSVRDERSRKRLEALGVDVTIDVVPDPAFVVPRLFGAGVLERRRALHHLMGWLPHGPYVVVQGNRSTVPLVGRLGLALQPVLDEHAELSVVALQTGPSHGDEEFVRAVHDAFPVPVHAMPSTLLVEDIASTIAGAEATIAVSLHATITAVAFGRSAVIVNVHQQSKLSALGDQLTPYVEHVTDIAELPPALRRALAERPPSSAAADLCARVDHHFDSVAGVLERCVRSGGQTQEARGAAVVGELHALRRAHATRGRQLASERNAFAVALATERSRIAELIADHSGLAARLDDVQQQLSAAHAQLGADRALLLAAQTDAAAARTDAAVAQTDAAVARQERDAAQAWGTVLREQLDRTEMAVDAYAATKTMRGLRVPRAIYGWLRR